MSHHIARALLLGTLVVPHAARQETRRVVITSEIACPECSIVIDTIATPIDPSSSGFGLVSDSRGRHYLVGAEPRWVHVLGPDLKRIAYLGKELKRPGYTFTLQQPHLGPGDTIYLRDGYRIGVYEPNRLRWIRTVSVARGLEIDEICPGPGGTFVTIIKKKSALITGFGVSEEATVGVFDRRGRLVRQFRVASHESGPSVSYPRTELRDSTLWIADPLSYTPALWNISGRKLVQVERRADWFPEYVPPRRHPGLVIDEHRPPRIEAIWADSAGRLWTVTSVTTKHRKLLPPYRVNQEGEVIGEDPRLKHPREPRNIDTTTMIIEVLDVKNGRLLASRKIEPRYLPPIWNGETVDIVDDSTSGAVMRRIRYRLSRPSR